jgi:hypothetical protein
VVGTGVEVGVDAEGDVRVGVAELRDTKTTFRPCEIRSEA